MKSPLKKVELLDHGGHGIVFSVFDGNANLALKLFFGSSFENAKGYANKEYEKLNLLRWIPGIPTAYFLFHGLNFEDFGELPFEPPHQETVGFTMQLMTNVDSLYNTSTRIPTTYFDQLIIMASEVHKRGLALPSDLEHNLHIRADGHPVIFDWGDAKLLVGQGNLEIAGDYSLIARLQGKYTR
tara:strand:+ start:202 stop:753 length:552 start_codon:yes stop_codon:yes gene_type:complete